MAIPIPGRRVRRLCLHATRVFLLAFVCHLTLAAQRMPSGSGYQWSSPTEKTDAKAVSELTHSATIDPGHIYSLQDLIDFAEQHSPETRISWNAMKAAAARTRLAWSELFPSLSVQTIASTQRNGVLFYDRFFAQELGVGEANAQMSYTVFDANERVARLQEARRQFSAAGYSLNEAHRHLLFSVMSAYYNLLAAQGLREAAEVTERSASTVYEATKARYDNELATEPDLSEAQSRFAQAHYETVLRRGDEANARAALTAVLTVAPDVPIAVQPLKELNIPETFEADSRTLMDEALATRPDLLRQSALIQAAQKEIRARRAAFYPQISFEGKLGELRAIGDQHPYPTVYSTGHLWDAEVALRWTVFDAGRRKAAVSEAQQERQREIGEFQNQRDEVEREVWQAYIGLQTALEQRRAAIPLLIASQHSYDQAVESYQLGLRNIVDVVTAERQLAAARYEDVSSRVAVLNGLALLNYQTSALLRSFGGHP